MTAAAGRSTKMLAAEVDALHAQLAGMAATLGVVARIAAEGYRAGGKPVPPALAAYATPDATALPRGTRRGLYLVRGGAGRVSA